MGIRNFIWLVQQLCNSDNLGEKERERHRVRRERDRERKEKKEKVS